MRFALTTAVWIGLAVSAASCPAFAQMHDNTEKQMTCQNGDYGDGARHCEIREQSVASIGRLSVDAARNGGVSIKGWSGGDVLVRARIDANAENESAAALMAGQVSIDSSGGQVQATGPGAGNNSWWSVSYEIFVPYNTDLTLKAHNGGLNIADVQGQIHFEATNGGVNLKRVAGEITGATTNGGVNVELVGGMMEPRQMDVSTRNGGVNLTLPANYSAHVQAETEVGSIQSDFPMPPLESTGRPRKLDMTVGAGGPLIHVSTRNGGVRLKKADTQ